MKNKKPTVPTPPPHPKPKYDVNIRVNREMGVARITFLRGNRRVRAHHYCSSEQLNPAGIQEVNQWMARNAKWAAKARVTFNDVKIKPELAYV